MRVKVEGILFNVCENCRNFGKVLGKAEEKKIIKKTKPAEEEKIEFIIEDYNIILKKAREKMGLKQEEAAKKINEKTSIIHKLENKEIEPSLNLARKLEKFFNIKLIFEDIKKEEHREKTEVKGFTLGDLIGK